MVMVEMILESPILKPIDIFDTPVMVEKTMVLPTVQETQLTSSEEVMNSIAPIKIPLVSSAPVLAKSPDYILTNEHTNRKNRLVLINKQLQKIIVYSPIKEPILDAYWYENQLEFLLMTSTDIYSFNPNNKHIAKLCNFAGTGGKEFKSFTIINKSTLLVAYDEWSPNNIEMWQQDSQDGIWKIQERMPIKLTCNEFIGSLLAVMENDGPKLVFTVYNDLLKQWRAEFHHLNTRKCIKNILLPPSNHNNDYRMLFVKNVQSGIKWLAFSPGNREVIAIDNDWIKLQVDYRNPVQRLAVFEENLLVVRTTERVDIHSFI